MRVIGILDTIVLFLQLSADIDSLLQHKVPESHEGKCLLFCFHKRFHIQSDDGSIDKAGAMQALEPLKEKDAAVYDKVVKVFEACKDSILCNIDRLELIMPRYAIRGGDVVLKCEHSVPPEQLYKVEWQKGGNKIFQYIKGRKPPFRYFPTSGADLNKANTSDMQIQLSKLDFSASGSYSCLVSMETPIFTKDSKSKDLTVIEPQEKDPTITFNKSTYEIGEVLEANCTTAAARPPPHITWLINGEKVPDTLTKSFSNGIVHGHGYFDQKASSIKQLAIEVSELHVGDDGELRLTCMSTIPGYINPNEVFADERKTSVRIEIEMTEGPVEAISNNNISSSCNKPPRSYSFEIINVVFISLFYYL